MLTKSEKRKYVRDYAGSFVDDIIAKIDGDKIPENWDGHEIRVWFADKMADDARCSLIRRFPRRKRARDYRNDVVVNNL